MKKQHHSIKGRSCSNGNIVSSAKTQKAGNDHENPRFRFLFAHVGAFKQLDRAGNLDLAQGA